MKGGKQLHSQSNEAGVAGLSWQTDSFAGCFPSTIKPSAANCNLMREDYEHFLKYGTSLHGELFCDGVRVPRKDGMPHAAPLPAGPIPRQVGGMDADCPVWTLRDAAIGEFPPTFPELTVHVMITDGCGCQVHISCVSLLLSRSLVTPTHYVVRRAQDIWKGCSGWDWANESETSSCA
jgi:hypothetical protein